MIGGLKGHLDKSAIDAILAELEIRPDCRAEQLTVDEMIELAKVAKKHWQELPVKLRNKKGIDPESSDADEGDESDGDASDGGFDD